MATLLVLEQCGITPPLHLGTVTLPLTFFDTIWLHFHPIQRVLFYEYPCSKNDFLETLVPNLKNSLSLALEHYYPLASNLLYPLSTETNKPMFRYVDGNSVSLTIAESKDDFDYLTANDARGTGRFYPSVPELPPLKEELEYKAIPVLSVQVTLFQNCGVSIGFTNHHTIGDASSIVGFIKAWARINENNTHLIEEKSLPLFDRSVIKDTRGVGDIWWSQLKNVKFQHPSSLSCLPTDKVRATYVVSQSDIQKLKDVVLAGKPGLKHPSSFVVTSAYVWTCLVRSGPASGEEVDADTPECFAFAADYRARLDPPVPANYFGNCIGGGFTEIKHGELIALEEKHLHGFVIAAEAIAEVIRVKVNKKEQDFETLLDAARELRGKRVLSVSGSPKFDLYSANYGWGRPKKMETVSIDGDDAFSLCKSRDSEGGLEVCLSLPKRKMDAFAVIFANGPRAFHH